MTVTVVLPVLFLVVILHYLALELDILLGSCAKLARILFSAQRIVDVSHLSRIAGTARDLP